MKEEQLLLRALKGEITDRVPFWFMRQAGRYLPEYRALRETSKGFLDLVFTPEKAAEVTLQPLRRFGMDGAILFSDILVIPYALGVDVTFEPGEGPIVEQVRSEESISQLRIGDVRDKLAPVAQTIQLVREGLPESAALIGFAGSPWTVACYMLEGRRDKGGVKEFGTTRMFAYREPVLMQKLMDVLIEATIDYLRMQVEAGAQALQIFGSWDGLLPPDQFARWAIAPAKKIIATMKQSHPDIPIIGFAKGAGANLAQYAKETGADCIGIDQQTPMASGIASRAHDQQSVQGNLDPLLVASDKKKMLNQAKAILEMVKDTPCVFNLGHGFIPQTPIENVGALSDLLKEYRR